MKIICSILLALISLKAHAQSSVFLEGTWRIENSNNYEHWDKLNDKSFQGFSYSLEGGKMVVAEYLNLEHQANKMIYQATVVNQNDGKKISFEQIASDDALIFENKQHDFPTSIRYKKVNDDLIDVLISNDVNQIAYQLIRQK